MLTYKNPETGQVLNEQQFQQHTGGNYKIVGYAPSYSQPTQSNKDFLDKATNVANSIFPGTKQIGNSIESGIANIKNLVTGGKSKFMQNLPQNTVDVPATAGGYLSAGATALGAAGVGTAGGLAARAGIGAGSGYALDVGSNLQNHQESPFIPGIGTAVGAGLPVVGAAVRPVVGVASRLVKGLASGLSGVSSETINDILKNPKVAQDVAKRLSETGNRGVLEGNAKTILNGVSQVNREAGAAYSKGLDSLAKEDINPEHLKQGFFDTLAKHNINVSPEGKLDFSNAGFLDPRIQQRAKDVISQINQQKDLSGTGVRKLMDTVESKKFKSAPDGDRQAFNAFVGDLAKSLKEGVGKSTNKLDEINSKFSQDKQLTEAVQNIFGKVNYRNLPEVMRASQKLEGLFNQKGIAPEVIDDFLTRIGVKPEDFRTSEAVRQIGNKKDTGNSVGLNFGEVSRSATSAVVTPEMVRNMSIATGMGKEKLIPFLRALKTPARNLVIQALLSAQQDNQQ